MKKTAKTVKAEIKFIPKPKVVTEPIQTKLPGLAPTRIVVSGDRQISNPEVVMGYLQDFCAWLKVDEIITGGNAGVDAVAERFALNAGISTVVQPPNWDRNGKRAAFIRNEEIARDADEVVVFTKGEDVASLSMISAARRMGKRVRTVRLKEPMPMVEQPMIDEMAV